MNEIYIVWWHDYTDASSDKILGCFANMDKARNYANDVARNSDGKFTRTHDNEWTRNHTITIQTYCLND